MAYSQVQVTVPVKNNAINFHILGIMYSAALPNPTPYGTMPRLFIQKRSTQERAFICLYLTKRGQMVLLFGINLTIAPPALLPINTLEITP